MQRTPPTQRADFQATRDPALVPPGRRGTSRLLGYPELYSLWERQQWRVQDIDFSQDRIDWNQRISPEERFERMYGLSLFFVAEQRVAAELGPMMRACPQEDMRVFLCTQIADEARHVAFFDRFYEQVGVLGSDGLGARLEETSVHLKDQFATLFDELLHRRVDRLARDPDDLATLVEAIAIYHMLVEGTLGLTGQHFMIRYNESAGLLPGFVEGMELVARDEHRHVAFGVRFLRDMVERDARHREAVGRAIGESARAVDELLTAPWGGPVNPTLAAMHKEIRGFAGHALERRLNVIGLSDVLPPALSRLSRDAHGPPTRAGAALAHAGRRGHRAGRRTLARLRARVRLRTRLRGWR